MKTVLKIMGSIVVLALIGGVMAYFAGFFETKIPVDLKGVMPPADKGRFVPVEISTEPLMEKAAGTVRAKVETAVSPLITATISSVSVRPGDRVKEGEVLVQLDSRELNARVDQAHQGVLAATARMEYAEKEDQRIQRIYKADPGAISRSEIDRVQTAVSTARAEVTRARRQEDEAKTALSYSRLTAPISGRVVDRLADPGDTARQGIPLIRMYDPGSLRLEAAVRESVASGLSMNQQLTVEIDTLGKQYASVVDEIVPTADPGSRTFIVKANLKRADGLYPGMFGRLLIPIGESQKIYIPLDAVIRAGQLNFVIVKSQTGSTRRYVRLGTTEDRRIQVISGLSPGEEILIPDRK